MTKNEVKKSFEDAFSFSTDLKLTKEQREAIDYWLSNFDFATVEIKEPNEICAKFGHAISYELQADYGTCEIEKKCTRGCDTRFQPLMLYRLAPSVLKAIYETYTTSVED